MSGLISKWKNKIVHECKKKTTTNKQTYWLSIFKEINKYINEYCTNILKIKKNKSKIKE